MKLKAINVCSRQAVDKTVFFNQSSYTDESYRLCLKPKTLNPYVTLRINNKFQVPTFPKSSTPTYTYILLLLFYFFNRVSYWSIQILSDVTLARFQRL